MKWISDEFHNIQMEIQQILTLKEYKAYFQDFDKNDGSSINLCENILRLQALVMEQDYEEF